jgi:hypothetical protein
VVEVAVIDVVVVADADAVIAVVYTVADTMIAALQSVVAGRQMHGLMIIVDVAATAALALSPLTHA